MSAPPTVPCSIDEAIRHAGARRRALRAARAVTIGLAVLAATGCASMVEPNLAEPAIVADATPEAAARDAAVSDTTVADAYDAPVVQDAAEAGQACNAAGDPQEYTRCCDENGWNWNLGCAAWGPFVPPEMPETEV